MQLPGVDVMGIEQLQGYFEILKRGIAGSFFRLSGDENLVAEALKPLAQINALVLIESEHFNSGDDKGTLRSAVGLPRISNDVRRHRLISINSISLLPCHGTARWYGRVREGVGGNRKESDNR